MSELDGQLTMDIGGAMPRTAPLPVGTSSVSPYGLTPSPKGEGSAEDERRLDVLAGQINMLEAQAKDTFRRTAIEIGRRLIEARGLVPAGRWGEWLNANVDYSERKAQQLMQVAEAEAHGELPAQAETMSFTQIYTLLAAPPEDREALAEAAVREELSTRELQARVKQLDEERRKQSRDLYDMIQQHEADQRDIERAKRAAEDARQEAEGAAQAMADLQDQVNAYKDETKAAQARMKDAIDARKAADSLNAVYEEQLRQLKEAPPEVREVMPEAEARELEQLRAYRAAREAADAAPTTSQADGARAAREKALAAALQIRLAIRGLRQALPLLNALGGLDGHMAAKVTEELKALAGEMIG